MNYMKMDEWEHLGKLIFEIEGAKQKRKGLLGKRTASNLAFYERGIVIRELGDYIEILKRNIVNVYYIAPMVGDFDCITIEIDYYDEGDLNIYPLDEATWNGIFARVDRLLDNEWNEFRKSKTEAPDNIKWFNAVNAVISLAGERDPEMFGGDVKSSDSAVSSCDMLYEYWGVNVRQDLLDQLEELYTECTQNSVAWDMSRMIWIASNGYLADYLSYDEAVNYCTIAGKKLQSLFSSWDNMFVNYMQGFISWSGEDHKDPNSKAYQRFGIYRWLNTLPRSPYRIDWNINL